MQQKTADRPIEIELPSIHCQNEKGEDIPIGRPSCEHLGLKKLSAVDYHTIEDHSNLKDGCTQTDRRLSKLKCFLCSRRYWYNNAAFIGALVLLLLVNIAMMIWAVMYYLPRSNCWIVVARMMGKSLNINCALMIVLVLHRTWCWVRKFSFARYLPLDERVHIHRILGGVIFVQSVIHTGAHVGNIVYVVKSGQVNFTIAEGLFTTKAHVGWVLDLAFITGWILMVVLLLLFIFSLSWVRRSKRFFVFQYFHYLSMLMIIVLILHCPAFWKYIIVPLILFFFEKLFSSGFGLEMKYGKCYIEKVILHKLPDDNIIELHITRPREFLFFSGDYLNLNIPAISRMEWHPFTISSAPENLDTVTLHIRTVGSWTESVHAYFKKLRQNQRRTKRREQDETRMSLPESVELPIPTSSVKEKKDSLTRHKKVLEIRERVFIDGPLGVLKEPLERHKHVILVATGIGVTPFTSLLRSLCIRRRQLAENQHLKYLNFVWVAKHLRGFCWFYQILQDTKECLNTSDRNLHFGMQLFFTRMKPLEWPNTRAKFEKGEVEFTRPNFVSVFQTLLPEDASAHVYFCGSRALASIVRKSAQQHNLPFTQHCF